MKLFSNTHSAQCLLTMFAVVMLSFLTAPCRAQDEGQLLHAGLLGYAGGVENEAMLLSPAIFGQVNAAENGGGSSDVLDAVFHFRLGHFHFRENRYGDIWNGVPYFGVSGTHPISDYLSIRGSLDLGFGDELDLDVFIMPLKFTMLGYPLADLDLGNIKPYLGAGVELDYYAISTGSGFDVGDIIDSKEWGLGTHLLIGAEYYCEGISVGLEISWSYVDVAGGYPGDLGGVSYMLNIGIPF